jgi:hypothetical protein
MKESVVTLISTVVIVLSAVVAPSSTVFAASKASVPSDFDATFYAETYPDVKAAIGTDPEALYNHYVQYGQKEGRLPNAQGKTLTDTSSAATTKNNSSFYTEGDVNYLRASYLANWGTYTIGQTDSWGEGDPAVGFTRQDYSSDPYYVSLKNELENLARQNGTQKYASFTTRTTCYLGNNEDSKYYHNLIRNLQIDLIKSGLISNGVFMLNPADGEGHLYAYGLDYVCVGSINDHQLDKADIAAHPEIKGYYNKGSLSGQ